MSDVTQAIDALAGAVLARFAEKLSEMTPVTKRLFTLDEAAQYLNCTPWQVRKLIRDGWLSPVEWSAGPQPKRYFDVRDLDAAIERAKRKGTE